MTLALLLTAVTGAWADETPLLTIESKDYQSFKSGSMTFDDKVTVTFSGEVFNDGDEEGWYAGSASLLTVAGTNGYTITSCKFYTGYGIAVTGYTVEGESPSVYLYAAEVYTDNSKSVSLGSNGVTKIEVYGTAPAAAEPAIKVTTNAAEEGATFTEATFAMPAFDATAEYELVRDMGYKVAFSGIPTRARLAKDGEGKFHFADGLTFQLLDNIDAANPKDITSAEGITFMVGEVEAVDFEGSTFYQLNKATLVPLADFLADAHLGNYAICAVASTGEYDGSFSSGRIELFQGYEVTVPAGEYATYFKDEALYVENENAQLYTISSVTESEAVLSDAIKVAPAETPLLVYNKSEQDKTFLLIPATEDADAVTPASQFKGTLEAASIPASTSTQDNYALNGKAFVWVKNALNISANKCWLQINYQLASTRANTRSIVGGNGTTGIDAATSDDNEGDYYDLQGRKVEKPNRKGIYIHNGKKVIVR